MKLKILIAEPYDILRTGLKSIFSDDARTEHIYEALTKEDLYKCLQSNSLDLIVINQSLITNFNILPRGHFVVIADSLDLNIFQLAYKHGAKGYILENSPAELLLATLSLKEGAFLIEPTISSQIIDGFSGNLKFAIKEELLTPREREIVNLLRDGCNRRSIAKQLSISEATLKTHIKNIAKKHDHSNHAQQEMENVPYLLNKHR